MALTRDRQRRYARRAVQSDPAACVKIEEQQVRVNDPLVHHHLGMGDHLTCCGLVRTVLGTRGYTRLRLVAKECNARNVRFLYRDEPRIEIVTVPVARDRPDNEYAAVERVHGATGGELLRIGHDHYGRVEAQAGGYIQCDQVFYRQMDVPYEYRFDKFYFERDPAAEREVVARLNPGGGPYIFVDCDASRGRVPPDTVESVARDSSVRIIHNDVSVPLLHLGALLEGAEEIHVSESAVRCLVEGQVFDMRKPRLYLQGNLRGNNTRLPWIFTGGARALTYPMYRGQGGGPTPNGHQGGPFCTREVESTDTSRLTALFAVLAGSSAHFTPHPLTGEAAVVVAGHKGRDFYAVATIGDEAVGYGMLRGLDDGHTIPSLGIAIHPTHRGCGVGRRVMTFLHDQARQMGFASVRLRVHPSNAAAAHLYRSLGYVDDGEDRGQSVMRILLSPSQTAYEV